MMSFYEKLDLAVSTGKITMEYALQLANQHKQEIATWKESKKYAKPRDYARVNRRLQWWN